MCVCVKPTLTSLITVKLQQSSRVSRLSLSLSRQRVSRLEGRHDTPVFFTIRLVREVGPTTSKGDDYSGRVVLHQRDGGSFSERKKPRNRPCHAVYVCLLLSLLSIYVPSLFIAKSYCQYIQSLDVGPKGRCTCSSSASRVIREKRE